MANCIVDPHRPLRIVHVLRAPLGGLFRHVLDLAREQTRRGHRVGLIADSATGGDNADRVLSELAPGLKLGLARMPMRREPHPSDLLSLGRVYRHLKIAAPDVIHGHGSKGGVYARLSGLLPGLSHAICAYTPHGGSLNHRPGTVAHRLYMQAERQMAARTDLLLFESGFIAGRYGTLVGPPPRLSRVVRNGIAEAEFVEIRPRPDAVEFLYVGELRAAKGIDTLLDALALVGARLRSAPRALLVGTGPDREALQRHAERIGLGDRVSFAGSLPARHAFERGKVLVVPSRAESLPYIVLEAAGARIPLIATNVGGIPEIFGPFRDRLLPPDNVELLAARMVEMISAPDEYVTAASQDLARFVHAGFSVDGMVDGVLAAYRDALVRKAAERRAFAPAVAAASQSRGAKT